MSRALSPAERATACAVPILFVGVLASAIWWVLLPRWDDGIVFRIAAVLALLALASFGTAALTQTISALRGTLVLEDG